MTAIEHDNTIADFQQLYAVTVVHSSRVCDTFGVDRRRNVLRQHAAYIVIVIIAELLGQCEAVGFIEFAKRLVWIHELVRPSVHFFVRIVVKVQMLNLNDISKFISHR